MEREKKSEKWKKIIDNSEREEKETVKDEKKLTDNFKNEEEEEKMKDEKKLLMISRGERKRGWMIKELLIISKREEKRGGVKKRREVDDTFEGSFWIHYPICVCMCLFTDS